MIYKIFVLWKSYNREIEKIEKYIYTRLIYYSKYYIKFERVVTFFSLAYVRYTDAHIKGKSRFLACRCGRGGNWKITVSVTPTLLLVIEFIKIKIKHRPTVYVISKNVSLGRAAGRGWKNIGSKYLSGEKSYEFSIKRVYVVRQFIMYRSAGAVCSPLPPIINFSICEWTAKYYSAHGREEGKRGKKKRRRLLSSLNS